MIDLKSLEIIINIEKDLQAFRGIRHLWANQVGGGRPSQYSDQTLDAETLLKEQKRLLWVVIGRALELHNHLWRDEESLPHEGYVRREVIRCSRCGDNVYSVTFGLCGRCLSAVPLKTPEDWADAISIGIVTPEDWADSISHQSESASNAVKAILSEIGIEAV